MVVTHCRRRFPLLFQVQFEKHNFEVRQKKNPQINKKGSEVFERPSMFEFCKRNNKSGLLLLPYFSKYTYNVNIFLCKYSRSIMIDNFEKINLHSDIEMMYSSSIYCSFGVVFVLNEKNSRRAETSPTCFILHYRNAFQGDLEIVYFSF